jgi:hypothetical protein
MTGFALSSVFNQPLAEFVFLQSGEKFPPIEKEWQRKGHTFQEATAFTGNVGVLAGNGYIGLDKDEPEAFDDLELPISTTWETRPGRSGMWFTCSDNGNRPRILEKIGKKADLAQLKLYKNGRPVGELKLERTYQVIPPSWKLVDGQRVDYKLLSEVHPAEISLEKLLSDLQNIGITFNEKPEASRLEQNASKLEDMVTKTRRKKTETDEQRVRHYAQAAIRDEVATLASAPEGARNSQLNKSAFALGQFVGAGVLAETDVIRELSGAATYLGLDQNEIEKTIRSGLESGAMCPRVVDCATNIEKARSIQKNLSDKIKEDPGIIYEPEYFDALREIFYNDPREWTRVKKILQACKVSIRDLVNTLKEGEKETSIVQTPFVTLDEGRLAEMVIQKGSAKFAVYDPATGRIEYVSEIMLDGIKLVPRSSDEIFRKGYVTSPSEAEEYGSELELYHEIQKFVHRYLEVSEDYETVACFYPMLTWVYDVMPVIAYLRAKGDWGVGKSRFLDVFRVLCYRSISTTGAMSEAPIFRIMDAWKGTLIIDEGDFGKSRDSTAAMEKILNCGFERGKPIIRCNPNNPEEVNVFDPFGPKIIATRYEFRDKALESRCFSEIMKESVREDVPIQLPSEFEEGALHLRNKLLMYRFRNREKVRQTSETDKIEMDLTGLPKRIQQAARPLSVILADHRELLATLKDFLVQKSKALVAEASETTEGYLVRILDSFTPLSNDGEKIVWNTDYGSITEQIKSASGNHKLTSALVRSRANSLGFKTERTMINGDQKRRIVCNAASFERLKKRYVPQVDNVDNLDDKEGQGEKTRAPNPSITQSDERENSSGGCRECQDCQDCLSTGKIIEDLRAGEERLESKEQHFKDVAEGLARPSKRECCLCGRKFPYDLTPYYDNGLRGNICATCHMGGSVGLKPVKPDPQTTLDDSEAQA